MKKSQASCFGIFSYVSAWEDLNAKGVGKTAVFPWRRYWNRWVPKRRR